jgi:hypothetical protein
MQTRGTAKIVSFEIRFDPPTTDVVIGQTCRLPWERIKSLVEGRPPLRIQPWRRPDPPPPAT